MIDLTYYNLNKYEEQLKGIKYNMYARVTPEQLEDMYDLYFQIFDKSVTAQEKSCTSCKMRIMRELCTALEEEKNKRYQKDKQNGSKGRRDSSKSVSKSKGTDKEKVGAK